MQSSSKFIANELENEVIASVHSGHLVGRAIVFFMCRLCVLAVTLSFTAFPTPEETEDQLIIIGFLLGARAVGRVVFCLSGLYVNICLPLIDHCMVAISSTSGSNKMLFTAFFVKLPTTGLDHRLRT